MALFNRKNKVERETTKQVSSYLTKHNTILKHFDFHNFDAEQDYINAVAKKQANIFNSKIIINSLDTNVTDKINHYLSNNNFHRKNWISEVKKSKDGVTGYLIFQQTTQISFVPINFATRSFDVLGNLTSCQVYYDEYNKGALTIRLYENYQLTSDKVVITREIFSVNNDSKKLLDFETYKNTALLKQTEELSISYIPIVQLPNLPDEVADCDGDRNLIKIIDLVDKGIIWEILTTMNKFMIDGNSLVGSVQEVINQNILDFLFNNAIVVNYDADGNPQPVTSIGAVGFKGKNLTDMRDWLTTTIDRNIGVHVPSLEKGAQQTAQEVSSVNISTINMIEQKIQQRQGDLTNFIKMLLQFDHDINKDLTFDYKGKIEELAITVEVAILNPQNNQVQPDKQNKGVNND